MGCGPVPCVSPCKLPGRKDVAFIKAKHGKGAAQSGRHTRSGGYAQTPASRWKQVLLTLLFLIALLALLGGALWQNICYNRTHIWEFPSKKGCRARSIPFVYLQINRRRCPA